MSETANQNEFAQWFAGSQVTANNGKPMLVYHGTYARFDTFDMDKARDGAHFFTDNPQHAGRFGVVSAYALSMSNPLVINQEYLEALWDEEHPDGEQDDRYLLPRDFVSVCVARAREAGHDGLIIRQMGDMDVEVDMYLPLDPGQIRRVGGPALEQPAAKLNKTTNEEGPAL